MAEFTFDLKNRMITGRTTKKDLKEHFSRLKEIIKKEVG